MPQTLEFISSVASWEIIRYNIFSHLDKVIIRVMALLETNFNRDWRYSGQFRCFQAIGWLYIPNRPIQSGSIDHE